MRLESAEFENTRAIPERYTCSGRNVSPQISWKDVPENTQSFALIVDDPDAPAGAWTHWLVYNIPGTRSGLQESFPAISRLEDGTLQGTNDFHRIGYGGPCPPRGDGMHNYVFRLFALDSTLNLKPGASKAEIEGAMSGHVLGRAELTGQYER